MELGARGGGDVLAGAGVGEFVEDGDLFDFGMLE